MLSRDYFYRNFKITSHRQLFVVAPTHSSVPTRLSHKYSRREREKPGEREREREKMGSLLRENEMERVGGESELMDAILYINGVRRILPDGLANFTLLEYLRGNPYVSTYFPLILVILASNFHSFAREIDRTG